MRHYSINMTREDAADLLANRRFAASTVKRAALTKSSGIAKWFGGLSTTQKGALLGALGGGGVGLVSGLGSDDKDRSWWRDSLTGALGGGAAGLGAGALIQALQDKVKQRNAEASLFESAGVPDGDTEALAKALVAGEVDSEVMDELLKANPSFGNKINEHIENWSKSPSTGEKVRDYAGQALIPAGASLTDAEGNFSPGAASLYAAPLVTANAATKKIYNVLNRADGGKPRLSMDVNQTTALRDRMLGKANDGVRTLSGDAMGRAHLDKYLDDAKIPDHVKSVWRGEASPDKAYYTAMQEKGVRAKTQTLMHSLIDADTKNKFEPTYMRSNDSSWKNMLGIGKNNSGSKQVDTLAKGNRQWLPSLSTYKANTPPAGRIKHYGGKGVAALPYVTPAILSLLHGAGGDGTTPSAGAARDWLDNLQAAPKQLNKVPK